METCLTCNGICGKRELLTSGWKWVPCYQCSGLGKITKQKSEEIKIEKIRFEAFWQSHNSSGDKKKHNEEECGDTLYGPGTHNWKPV
jgi:DnaJ-class molecular chaperone